LKLSVVITTFNGADYLSQQLKSLERQKKVPNEIIILDDGSSDETVKIITEFMKKSPMNTNFYQNERNLGYAQNFSKALSLASGDLVFMCDQDDVWFPEKLMRVEEFALKNSEKQVFLNDAILTDNELNPVGITRLQQIRNMGLDDSHYILGCCCAVKREFLLKCLPIPGGFSHDSWIINMARILKVKLIIGESLQFYRRHSANESQNIANSTKQLSIFALFFHRLKNLERLRSVGLLEEKIIRTETFLKGIIPFENGVNFNAVVVSSRKNLQSELDELRQSLGLRQYRILSRPFQIINLLLKGDYYLTPRKLVFDFIGQSDR